MYLTSTFCHMPLYWRSICCHSLSVCLLSQASICQKWLNQTVLHDRRQFSDAKDFFLQNFSVVTQNVGVRYKMVKLPYLVQNYLRNDVKI